MQPLIDFLRGKKTFVLAICLFVVSGLEGIGVISNDLATVLKGLFAAGAIASMRSALNNK